MFIRFIAGLILGLIYGGLMCLGVAMIVNGFAKQDWAMVVVGTGLVALIVAFAVISVRKYKKKKASGEGYGYEQKED